MARVETERYVLFSPIGMTDPIAEYHDGSMLHIARKFKPERVYMYLSKETSKLDEDDDRYARALKLLGGTIKRDIDVVKFRRSDLIDVHLFDEFYDEFEKLIKQIKENISTKKQAFPYQFFNYISIFAECKPIYHFFT